jgi:hypothetical protein
MKHVLIIIVSLSFLSCCALIFPPVIGHKAWSNYQDSLVGKKALLLNPTLYSNAGEIIRGRFLIQGKGFTHTSKNKDGDTIQHWDSSEVLSIYSYKEKVGKCLHYLVVDPVTHIIKSWGIDEGGNPESCRLWP